MDIECLGDGTVIYMQISQTGTIIQQLQSSIQLNPEPSWATNSFQDNDTEAENAFNDPTHYTLVNNSWTYTAPTSAEQLQKAQQAQIALINLGLNQTLIGGFTSKTTTHTYVTTTNGQANMEGDLKRFELDSTLTSVQFYTIDKGWLAHNHQDLINAFLDGGKWKDAQYAQAQTLIGQINSATTISAVQAISWTPEAY